MILLTANLFLAFITIAALSWDAVCVHFDSDTGTLIQIGVNSERIIRNLLTK
jgi:hypothetical protein